MCHESSKLQLKLRFSPGEAAYGEGYLTLRLVPRPRRGAVLPMPAM
jgi:hypothetical protein